MNTRIRSIVLSSMLAAGAAALTLVPAKAQAYWVRLGFPGVVIAPPAVYAPPPPYYYAPPYYAPPVAYAPPPHFYPHRVWIAGHYHGPYWVPGHWARG